MNARLLFILLLFVIGALWYIIGYWRRKAGEAAFAAARLAEKSEERERYCRLAVWPVIGKPAVCSVSCTPNSLMAILPISRSNHEASESLFTGITIRHDTMRCSMMNRGPSAIPSTNSNKEIYTESSSLKRA